MEKVFEKRDIIRKLKDGISIDELNKETGISKKKLHKWTREIKIRARIEELIDLREYEEAKQLIEFLKGPDNEIIRLVFLTQIARREENREEEKRLSEKQLDIEPNNVVAMSNLIRILREEERIAREAGNAEEVERIKKREKYFIERRLKLEPENIRIMSTLIRILREEENIAREAGNTDEVKRAMEREKELVERQLDIEPNDVLAMSALIRILREETNIAREEGNTEEVKKAIEKQRELAERQLQIDPEDMITISTLLRILREEEDIAREEENTEKLEKSLARQEELLEIRLKAEPSNPRDLSNLIRIAKAKKDMQRAKKLLEKLIQVNPDNLITKRELDIIIKKLKDADSKIVPIDAENEIAEKMLKDREEQETSISLARKIIYESKDIKTDAEEIQKLLEGENETNRTIILAELYYHTGLIDRANKQLKAYKRTLDPSYQSEDIRAINEALRIVQSKRMVGFEWNEFWNKREALKVQKGQDDILADQAQISADDEER